MRKLHELFISLEDENTEDTKETPEKETEEPKEEQEEKEEQDQEESEDEEEDDKDSEEDSDEKEEEPEESEEEEREEESDEEEDSDNSNADEDNDEQLDDDIEAPDVASQLEEIDIQDGTDGVDINQQELAFKQIAVNSTLAFEDIAYDSRQIDVEITRYPAPEDIKPNNSLLHLQNHPNTLHGRLNRILGNTLDSSTADIPNRLSVSQEGFKETLERFIEMIKKLFRNVMAFLRGTDKDMDSSAKNEQKNDKVVHAIQTKKVDIPEPAKVVLPSADAWQKLMTYSLIESKLPNNADEILSNLKTAMSNCLSYSTLLDDIAIHLEAILSNAKDFDRDEDQTYQAIEKAIEDRFDRLNKMDLYNKKDGSPYVYYASPIFGGKCLSTETKDTVINRSVTSALQLAAQCRIRFVAAFPKIVPPTSDQITNHAQKIEKEMTPEKFIAFAKELSTITMQFHKDLHAQTKGLKATRAKINQLESVMQQISRYLTKQTKQYSPRKQAHMVKLLTDLYAASTASSRTYNNYLNYVQSAVRWLLAFAMNQQK